MKKILSFIGLILVGLISMTLVEIQADPTAKKDWHVVAPVSEVENSALYRVQSDFDGKHYESVIYGRDLKGVEKWTLGKELPTSLSTITADAQNAFHKQFPQLSQFKIMSINLVHLTIVDDWIINVEFNGTDFAAADLSSVVDKKINILVLLNGHVITLAETAK